MKILRYIIGVASLIGVAMLAYTPAAYAAQVTSDFHVIATVPGTCTVSTMGNLNFGNYTGAAVRNVPTTLNFTCTANEAVHIGMGMGQNSMGSTRRVQSESPTGHYLTYTLNKTTGCNSPWGPAGSTDLHITATGSAQQETVYGCMPSGQFGGVQGQYDDLVTVTLDF